MKKIKAFNFLTVLYSFFIVKMAMAETIELPNPIQSDNFYDLLNSIANALIYLSGPIAAGAIIYAGYIYMSSGGDENEIEKAKNILTWTIIGFMIILTSKGLVLVIKNLLGGSS